MASVHVIIPCYNYGHYLPAAVSSALNQVGVDVSVIIIDDASSDESADVAQTIAAADDRVSVICHAVNKGHIATYNEGLARVDSRYVVLLSADDLLTPGSLFRATALMEANQNVGLVYGHPLVFSDQTLPPARTNAWGSSIWRGHDWVRLMCRTGRNFIYCPEVVLRTSVQHQIGFYSANLPHSADMEMWMRAALVSDIGRIRGADQAYYRLHSLSMQRTVHTGLAVDLKGRAEAFDAVLGNHDCRLEDARYHLEAARRALAQTALRHASRCIAQGVSSPEIVETYRSLACELSSDVIHTRTWGQVGRAMARPGPRWARTLSAAASRHRQALAWRYWKWSGIDVMQ